MAYSHLTNRNVNWF